MSVLDQFSLAGQKAVVTGAGKGIGRAIALALAEAGADVAVAARTASDVEAVAREIQALGRKAVAVPTDVTNVEQVAKLAQTAEKALGGITIWVNNAGGQPDGKQRRFVEVWEQNFHDQVDLNLKSVWAGVVEAARHMKDGGSIINISSRAAKEGMHTGHALYAASKAAVNSLTTSLAFELGPRIRVNGVAPGPTMTETFFDSMQMTREQAEKAMSAAIPVGRVGESEDMGPAVVFLCSPAASWISGQMIYVAGGL